MRKAGDSASIDPHNHSAVPPSFSQQSAMIPTEDSLDPRRAALYATLAQIPSGQVISYGQLAQLAGLGRAARWVGRTLSQLPEGSALPWHRVIAASGRLSLPAGSPSGDEQRARLAAEGVLIHNQRVDMRRHGWHPTDHNS